MKTMTEYQERMDERSRKKKLPKTKTLSSFIRKMWPKLNEHIPF
jgi:hypothetical protein